MIELKIPDHPIFHQAAAEYFAALLSTAHALVNHAEVPHRGVHYGPDEFAQALAASPAFVSRAEAVQAAASSDGSPGVAYGSWTDGTPKSPPNVPATSEQAIAHAIQAAASVPDAAPALDDPAAAFGAPVGFGAVPPSAAFAYSPPQGATVGQVAEVGRSDVLPPAFTPEPFEPGIHNIDVERDGRGFPWDARIHGSSKQLLAKPPHGYKYLRGVSPELVAQVEAELKATGQWREPPASVGAKPVATVITGTAPPPPVGPPTTFADLSNRLAVNGKFPALEQHLPTLGVESFGLLANRPDLWPAAAALVGV